MGAFAPTLRPMRVQPGPLFLLLSYIALSAVPFVPLAMGKPVDQPWQMLGMEIVAWTAVWAAFKRPAYFHWLLLPAFLALPTEVYLIIYYGQGISTHHLGIIAETSPKEAMEFLGRTVWLMGAVLLTAIAWFVAGWRMAFKTRALDWNDASRWVALAIVGVLGGVAAYGWEFGVAGKPAPPKAAPAKAPAKAADKASASGAPAAGASAPTASAAASGFGDVVPGEDEEEVQDAVEADEAPETGSVPAAGRTGWKLRPLAHWARVPVEFDAFTGTWPFGLMARGVDFYKERQHLAELGSRSGAFTFKARQAEPNEEPEVVVLVIGESSRYDRWSLNGYQRETNPLLSREGNLVALRDVITAVSATRLSVPVIISRKPATQSLRDGFAEKSFITAYKEAGFKTYWLSNQISFGQFDTPVSVFAKEADVIQFLNLGGFTNNSNFDQILLAPLRQTLAAPAPKKLIVLHTLGSHWNYSQRHPAEFDKWKPSLYGVNKPAYTDLRIKEQLNNSYDNSVLYTDWFLSQVIAALKSAPLRSSLVYVSDHGQTLYDGACRLAFHGHNTQYEFHVPAFVWYSDQYKDRYPDKVRQLERHRKSRLATENMFHTLLDLGDIRYPGERLEWSFVNKQFKHHKRYVDSYGWTNYDNAIVKGACREVIDRNKPLKQD
ncbi:phosphoethanolamine transferase [Pseudoduganella namucuonensis]|uniref:Sulfatase n=1 Tax=Pseudoduganella namucuonensis TaxID=1035707 RepID=A0A1I7LD32_9BURK|nr:phosphoethanolamine transferase [Pseudoduganella namucuonensis]SFV07599.1 Sulfatase [Pseudoduganella namucuonensis]